MEVVPSADSNKVESNFSVGDTISEEEIQLAIGQGRRAWGRSKIMIVGEGRAGKTALANSLIGKRFEETTSTLGINQVTCDVKVSSDGKSAWDACTKPQRELELALAKIVSETRQLQQQQHVQQLLPPSSTATSIVPQNSAPVKALDLSLLCSPLHSNLDSELGHQEHAPMLDEPAGVDINKDEVMNKEVDSNDNIPIAPPSSLTVDESALIKCLADNIQFNSKYILSIFDFGGQSIFDVIHPFFLTHYGIYIIAFNMEWLLPSLKDTKEYKDCLAYITFWLNNIVVHTQDKEHGQISPIILVGSRKDKVFDVAIHEAISTELYQQFSHNLAWSSVVENSETDGRNGKIDLFFFPVNNLLAREDPTMKKLLESIEKEIDLADYVHVEQPLSWFKAYDEMVATESAFLTLEETQAIAARCGLFPTESSSHNRILKNFLLFLHQMGMLMWHDEESLRDLVILQPIDYFVRPATVIICKHEPTIEDNLYHSLPIHKKVKKYIRYEWDQMVKNGFVSSKLIQALLLPATVSPMLVAGIDTNYCCKSIDHLEMVVRLMIKYGLIVELGIPLEKEPSTPRVNSTTDLIGGDDYTADEIDDSTRGSIFPSTGFTSVERQYLAPALLPKKRYQNAIADSGDENPSNELDTATNSEETEIFSGEHCVFYLIFTINHKYFDPPGYSFSGNNNGTSSGGGNSSHSSAAITLDDCKKNGFLPSGLFERLICKAVSWSQHTSLQHDVSPSSTSALLTMQIYSLSKGEAWLTYGSQRFQMTLQSECNVIKVAVEGKSPVAVYTRLKEQVEGVIAECMNTLKFFTALPLPINQANSNKMSRPLLIPLKDIRNAAQRYSSLHLLPLSSTAGSSSQNAQLTTISKKSTLTTVEIHDVFMNWLEDLNHNHKAVDSLGYDIFLSYRWGKEDSFLVRGLFDRFTLYTLLPDHRAVYVFLDTFRLTTGKSFQEEFAKSLIQSTIVVPIVSCEALQRMVQHDPTIEDNVMVEWIIAYYAHIATNRTTENAAISRPSSAIERGHDVTAVTIPRVKRIIPIMIGATTPNNSTPSSIFASGIIQQLPSILHPTASIALARRLLLKHSIPFDEDDMRTLTVKMVVERIIQNLGIDSSQLVASNNTAIANVDQLRSQMLNIITGTLMKNIQECVMLTSDNPGKVSLPASIASVVSSPPTSSTASTTAHSCVTDDVSCITFNSLSVRDVCELLQTLGLSMYKDAFESNFVDGRALVECTSESDLKDAGIDKAFHARKLLSYLNEWRDSQNPGVPRSFITK